jgi:virginiamycin B lyase
MSRLPYLSLIAGCFSVLATLGVQGQERQGGGRGGQVQLPDGPGKEIVQTTCSTCHGLNSITGSAGYTAERWQYVFGAMVKLPDDKAAAAAQYLATHFPPKPGREPKLIPGPVTVSFKEWVVPTLGQRARDPFQLPDGTIWWTGQFASIVGRLNPRTGEMKEFKVAPDAHPHSIIADTAGNIWYMGNGNGTIGKMNPVTGEATVYKMPDPAARDPHTPIWSKDGSMLFFTLQQSNMVGRLNPATGEIKLVTVPTTRALPYGIKINSQGEVWVSYNGAGKVASLDPVTMAIREFPMPEPQGSHARRLAIASDDTVWYVNSGLGRLGRLNPKTGEIKEWPSPSGPQSHPYAIAIVDDVIWYNESARRPDALVRFDPKTEKFQSWAIPSGVGIIRNMSVTPDGNLAIHQSAINRIGIVTIGKSPATTSSR